MTSSRLPPLGKDGLDPEQLQIWDGVMATTRVAGLVGPDGGLGGPYNPMLYTPTVGAAVLDLTTKLREASVLDLRQREVAILATSAHWKSEFEFSAHKRYGLAAGVSAELIDLIATGTVGEVPDGHDLLVVNQAVATLLSVGHLSDELYAEAQQLVGDAGMVEIANIAGLYTLVCLSMNLFEIGSDEPPIWPTAAAPHDR